MHTAREATTRLAELLRRERHAMADFLLALADFDRQRQWVQLGHASLFSFLRRELGLSAGAAQYRKTAAELVQRHPEVEAALRSGELCLSSIVELAKVVTTENVAEVLPRFFGLSRREAAEVAVAIRPVERPPVRDVVTFAPPEIHATALAVPALPLQPASSIGRATSADDAMLDGRRPSVRPAEAEHPKPRDSLAPMTGAITAPTACAAAPGACTEPRPAIEPLDADRARLHVTVSRRFLAKLQAAKAELSHARPGATSEDVLEAALDALLAMRAKRKGLVEKPRKTRSATAPAPAPTAALAAAPVPTATLAAPPPPPRSAIPAAVRREAWRRSGGGCEWPLERGGRCGSTLRLELDHVTPRAQGGSSTIDNVRVLCRFHNQLAAREAFGGAWMDQFRRDDDPFTRAATPSGGSARTGPGPLLAGGA